MRILLPVVLFFTILNLLAQPVSAQISNTAASPLTCSSYDQPVPWSVCIYAPLKGHNPDVLYYLHGLNGDEKTWSQGSNSLAIQKWWTDHNVDAPTVVSVSFGPVWLLAPKNTSPSSGLYDLLVKVIIPNIESQWGDFKGRRLVMGESMGGFNASQLLMRSPELFSKVVLGCPAIADLSPFSSPADIASYISKTHAQQNLVTMSVSLSHAFFPTAADWSGASPLLLGAKDLGPKSPDTFVSIGMQDEYGFQAGAEAFADLAKKMGVKNVVWKPLVGGHCTLDTAGAAEFLTAP